MPTQLYNVNEARARRFLCIETILIGMVAVAFDMMSGKFSIKAESLNCSGIYNAQNSPFCSDTDDDFLLNITPFLQLECIRNSNNKDDNNKKLSFCNEFIAFYLFSLHTHTYRHERTDAWLVMNGFSCVGVALHCWPSSFLMLLFHAIFTQKMHPIRASMHCHH